MATRMQQRRGTAAQWTAANPILAAGEIGFETDTNKFKMGNGSSAWTALSYFANATELAAAIDAVVGIAPETLDTLAEIAEALGDNPDFLSLYATIELTEDAIAESRSDAAVDATAKANAAAAAAALDATGKANAAREAAISAADTALSSHEAETTSVHGIPDTSLLATKSYADDAVSLHNDDTSSVHGIANTADLATKAYADAAADAAAAQAVSEVTTGSIGLGNVDNTSDADKPVSTAQATAIADAVSDHNLDETNVHGIADTAELVTQTQLTNAISGATVDQSALAGVGLEWNAGTDQFDIDETHITTATQSALDLKAPLADPTFTGTVSGVTKSHVGLGNVDNTSDANKPVSTATQTALDAKASLSGATFTGNVEVDGNLVVDGDLTVNGTNFAASATSITIEDNLVQLAHQNAANTVDLGIVVGYNDGAAKHAGLVRDVSDAKWKLFKGVTTEPSTTVDFTQGSLDDLKVAAFEATTVTASSGIVFSDGTQTKVGVPSITTFATAISSSATLASGEQDKFVPLTGAVTITLPATGYSTGQSIDFYQASGTGAQFASTNSVVGTPGLKFRTTNSVVTAMKTSSGWLVFGDLSA